MLSTLGSPIERLLTSRLIRWQSDPLSTVRHRYLFFLLCWLLFLSVSLHLVLLPYTYYSWYNPLPPAGRQPLVIASAKNYCTLRKEVDAGAEKYVPPKPTFDPLHRIISVLYLQLPPTKKASLPLSSDTCTFVNFIEFVLNDDSKMCFNQHFSSKLGRIQAKN